jgi:DNA-binding NtrC family response regulator
VAVFPIRIPPLRERGDDLMLIAEHFLERFRRELKKPRLVLSPEAVDTLRAHSWPGNIRELQNVIERAAILNDGEIGPSELNLARQMPSPANDIPQNGDRARIESVLRECKWNKQMAAERLGISYRALLSKVHEYGLD